MSIGKSKILEKDYRAVDRDYLPLFNRVLATTRTTCFSLVFKVKRIWWKKIPVLAFDSISAPL